MSNIETVDGSSNELITRDPLYCRRKEDVDRMRASLLACNSGNSGSIINTRVALTNITALRIYHQVNRVIKYLELMDKLEEKLHESIEYTIDNCDVTMPSTWVALLKMQSELQDNMIKSQKLLEPYLNPELLKVLDVATPESDEETRSPIIIDARSRDKIRNVASHVLNAVKTING